ncbi:MAG: tetratricopeptide repeat protein [Deltaproteobacteria bacterium]|nr:tetratricopeptide repeat protein [Deltaproteobacteria bacterium]
MSDPRDDDDAAAEPGPVAASDADVEPDATASSEPPPKLPEREPDAPDSGSFEEETQPIEAPPIEASELLQLRTIASTRAAALGTADEETLELPGGEPIEALPRGTTIASFVVIAHIGEDALGPIYSAFDVVANRKVALRLLPVPTDDPESAQRQLAVVDIMAAVARLSHPCILAVYDVGTWQGGVYVAMESFDGIELAKWMEARDEPFPWRAVIGNARDVGRALAAAHAQGVFHRDFTPDKVLLGPPGSLRVADFSLAPAVIDAPDAPTEDVARLRKRLGLDGAVPPLMIGTVEYAAPEVLAGAEADARSDQFSFCVALYEALYGERPWPADTRSALAGEMADGPPRTAPDDSRVPVWLRDALLRGLQIAPEDRWPSMERLIRELDRDPAASRRRWQRGLAAITVVGTLAGAGAWWVDRTEQRCAEAGSELEGVWDARRRAELSRVFEGDGAAYAVDNARAVGDAIDAWAGVWSHLQVEACEVTRVRGEASEELYTERRACMAVRLDELRALLSMLESIDAEGHERALAAAESLTSTRVCTRPSGLLELAVGPDVDPARVDDLRLRIARATTLLQLGRARAVEASLPELERDADGLAQAGVQVQLAQLRGATARALGRDDAAIDAFHDAAIRASQNELDQALALAWLELAATFADGKQLDEATRALDHARSLVERTPYDEVRWRVAATAGQISARAGRDADALARYHEALAQLERRRASTTAHYDLLLQLGELTAARGDVPAATGYFTRALELVRDRLGPQHPTLATPLLRLGELQLPREGTAAARATWERALVIVAEAHRSDANAVVEMLLRMATALREHGDADGALEYDGRALAAIESTHGDDDARATVWLDEGRSLLALGRVAQARVPLERSLAHRESVLASLGPASATTSGNAGHRSAAAQMVLDAGAELVRALAAQDPASDAATQLARRLRVVAAQHRLTVPSWLVGVTDTAASGAPP